MEQAVSTDALREALELKIDELLDEFVAELDRKTFEDYAQKRNTYSSRIAALAAHASETEKLPAAVRLEEANWWFDHIDQCSSSHPAVIEHMGELEAALKADQQG